MRLQLRLTHRQKEREPGKAIYRAFLTFVAALTLTCSALAQTSWNGPVANSVTDIGTNATNLTQRPTIASVVFNNQIYIAYSSTNCDGNWGCTIQIRAANSQASGGTFNFGTPTTLWVPTIGQVYTNSNPAMGVQNGIVYMAWHDEAGVNWMSMSTDMVNWSNPLSLATGTFESINIAFNPSTPNQMWASFVSLNESPVFCDIFPNTSNFSASASSCYTSASSGTKMLYNPALIWVGSVPLMFSTWAGSNHCLDEFFNLNGDFSNNWVYWNPKYNGTGSGLCNAEQTSSAPDPVLYNGNLYVGFRSNDSGANFVLVGGPTSPMTFIGDGSKQNNTWNWTQVSGIKAQHMDGSPDLLPLSSSQGISLLCSPELVNFYSQNGTLQSTYSCN